MRTISCEDDGKRLFDRLRARWLELGLTISEGVSLTALGSFEQKHDIRIPNTFKEYLLAMNGMEEGQTDNDLIAFFSLDAIERATNCKEVPQTETEMAFADFSLFSHIYVLRFKKSGEEIGIFATDGEHEKQIAKSFEEFINTYLANSFKVAYCWI